LKAFIDVFNPGRSWSILFNPGQLTEAGPMNIQKMMAQAQQMQEQLQRKMAEMKIGSTAGGGTVIVTVNGNKQLLSIRIDPEGVTKDDIEMLQDMIVAAVNDAHRKVDEALAGQMSGLMGGLGIPGLT
jgi:DNA-binding YbaB/EbfC family protein